MPRGLGGCLAIVVHSTALLLRKVAGKVTMGNCALELANNPQADHGLGMNP